jgi:hypothetical protein
MNCDVLEEISKHVYDERTLASLSLVNKLMRERLRVRVSRARVIKELLASIRVVDDAVHVYFRFMSLLKVVRWFYSAPYEKMR